MFFSVYEINGNSESLVAKFETELEATDYIEVRWQEYHNESKIELDDTQYEIEYCNYCSYFSVIKE